MEKVARSWPALWALIVGFFIILIDITIVSIANPKFMEGLKTDINSVIWVTSAYLLAYAVPLLVAGRLGDRYGPKTIYLAGLVVFTAASAWCGFSETIGALIAARTVQGFGASLMTPQTVAIITRIFPPEGRGKAMGLWGAVAGFASLVGPILGGALVGALGWQWIFFINLPIGVVAFVLAWQLVSRLETHPHHFDLLGVALNAIGMFLIVFSIQEGETYHWGTITGFISVWSLITLGVIVLVAFVAWQALNKREPLLPLELFRDRDFSLANAAIIAVGFIFASIWLPLTFFFQMVLGFSPIQSALMLVPMALLLMVFAPITGALTDKVNPRTIAFTGLILLSAGLLWYSRWLSAEANDWWRLLFPSALLGIASACIWSPISTAAIHNLPRKQAGAGSGVYNTTRQIGSVLGSASIAALIQARLIADLPGGANAANSLGGARFSGTIPASLQAGFTAAMAQSLLLPAAVAAVGALIVVFFARPTRNHRWE